MSRSLLACLQRMAFIVTALSLTILCSLGSAACSDKAYAAERIIVDGIAYTETASGDGWSWDGADALEINGFKGEAIMSRGALNVEAHGENALNYLGLEPTIDSESAPYSGDLVLTGDGSISFGNAIDTISFKELLPEYVGSRYYNGTTPRWTVLQWSNTTIDGPISISSLGQFYVPGDLTIKNGVELEMEEEGFGLCVDCDGTLTIEDSNVDLMRSDFYKHAIGAKNLIVNDSSLSVIGPDFVYIYESMPILFASDSIEFNGSNVRCVCGPEGILTTGTLTVNRSVLSIDAGQGLYDWQGNPAKDWDDTLCYAVRALGDITLEGVEGASITQDVGGGSWNDSVDTVWNTLRGPNGEVKQIRILPVDTNPAPGGSMFRLYNPFTGEHFYTAVESERDSVAAAGWTYEGIGWTAPQTGDPVYRLYNSYAGEHHYTPNADEHQSLLDAGWTDEGVGWLTAGEDGVPLYREYNPNMLSCNHNYTADKAEHESLVALGWTDEGVAWYGV